MKLKRIGKSVLIHATAAALSFTVFVGAAGAFGGADRNTSLGIVTEAADAPTSGKGEFRSGGHTYTYEYSTNDRGVETFTLKTIKVGNRNVSIPSQVYVDGRYHTVNTLGNNFGEYITAETVSMPNTITKINNYVFQNCKVGTLYVSSNVKDIGSYFCSMSRNLDNVVYSGTKLESLGTGAFSGIFSRDVYGLKRNSKGAYLFGDWLIRYTGMQTNVPIYNIGNGKIKKLGPNCFDKGDIEKNSILASVDLSGVTKIATSAFSSNPNLERVSNADSVEEVDPDAFRNTNWYNNQMNNPKNKNANVVMLGSILLYYHTDGKTIDLSGDQFKKIKTVNKNAISGCTNAVTLNLTTSLKKFNNDAFCNGSDVKKISNVYIGGKNMTYSSDRQFVPSVIGNSFSVFQYSKYLNIFKTAKIEDLFSKLGITNYGDECRNGVSRLSPAKKFDAAFKLHEYITTNFVYGFDGIDCFQPFLCGNCGFVCQGYAELYAYLLEYAGINAELVTSGFKDEKTNTEYHGNHVWNIVEIGGKWYHCDVCWDSENYGLGKDDTMYWFMVSDEFVRQNYFHAKWIVLDDPYWSNKHPFMSLKTTPKCDILLGDANGDGKRTSDDRDIIQRYLLKDKDACDKIKNRTSNCDTNFNGTIEMSDVINENNLIPRRSVDPLEGYGNHTVSRPNNTINNTGLML